MPTDTHTPPLTSSPLLEVTVDVARTDLDWQDARALLCRYHDWLHTVFSKEAMQILGGSLGAELTDPRAELARRSTTLLLGRMDGRTVGMLGVGWVGTTTTELTRMFVLPQARGHGVARRLLDRAVELARARGHRTVVLETYPPGMPAAVRLYQARGFTPIPTYRLTAIDGVIGMQLLLDADHAGDRGVMARPAAAPAHAGPG